MASIGENRPIDLGDRTFKLTNLWICEAHFPRHDAGLIEAADQLDKKSGLSGNRTNEFAARLRDARSGRMLGFDFDTDLWGRRRDPDALPGGVSWAHSHFLGVDPSLLLQVTEFDLDDALTSIPESILRAESFAPNDPFAAQRIRGNVSEAMRATLTEIFAWHGKSFPGVFAEQGAPLPYVEAFETTNFEMQGLSDEPWAEAMGFTCTAFSWKSDDWNPLRLTREVISDPRLVIGRPNSDGAGSVWALFALPAAFAWTFDRVIEQLATLSIREANKFHEARGSSLKTLSRSKGWLDTASDASIAISAAGQPWQQLSALSRYSFSAATGTGPNFGEGCANAVQNRADALENTQNQMARWVETFGAYQLQRASILLAAVAMLLTFVTLAAQVF